MFSRNVKFQVDIAPAHIEGADGQKLHCVNFTLLAGEARTQTQPDPSARAVEFRKEDDFSRLHWEGLMRLRKTSCSGLSQVQPSYGFLRFDRSSEALQADLRVDPVDAAVEPGPAPGRDAAAPHLGRPLLRLVVLVLQLHGPRVAHSAGRGSHALPALDLHRQPHRNHPLLQTPLSIQVHIAPANQPLIFSAFFSALRVRCIADPSFTPSAYALTHTFAMATLQRTVRKTVHTACVTACIAMCDSLGAQRS